MRLNHEAPDGSRMSILSMNILFRKHFKSKAMNPSYDLKCEHNAMEIILGALKKISNDISQNKTVDFFRVGQILDFLFTYMDASHHEKEEKYLFPAMLEANLARSTDILFLLKEEHRRTHKYLNEIRVGFYNFLTGSIFSLGSMVSSMTKFITLEENHIIIENTVLLPLSEIILDKKKQDSIYSDYKRAQSGIFNRTKNLEYFILLSKLYAEANAPDVENYHNTPPSFHSIDVF
jgi:hemerythrin-like domain-containing protein